MNATAAPTDNLANLANNTFFVLGAYFLDFFPWAVMGNIDFISAKWRTVRRTRRLAYTHLVLTIFPIMYVAAYAEAQRRVNDTKECGAALAALMFNLIQLMRTLMGMVQLDAFVRWCKHGVECMRVLLGSDEEDKERCVDMEDFDAEVKVNNTVVDNELGGTDVTVLPSLAKVWKAVRNGEFRPSSWLVTDQPKLCTVRWAAAFLCGIGHDWTADIWDWGGAADVLKSFFSGEMNAVRQVLPSVTWNIGDGESEARLFSINGLGKGQFETDLDGEMSTAYGTPVNGYLLDDSRSVNSYSFEFDCLVSSYPSSNDDFSSGNREKVGVGLVHSVVLAKHSGIEVLKRIRRYYARYRLPTDKIRRKAFELLLEQVRENLPEDSKVWELFDSRNWQIPIFPYRMQMVALWDQATNWRVLQASAHEDIRNSFFIPVFRVDACTDHLFDYWSGIARNADYRRLKPSSSVGLVIETVRTFLAEWLVAAPRKPDWNPVLPEETFEFVVSENALNTFYEYQYGLIWVCQHALQKELAKEASLNQDLPSNHKLIMLFLLGCPIILVDEIDEAEVGTQQFRNDTEEGSTSSSSIHHTVDVLFRVWKFSTPLAPQHITVLIRVDYEEHLVSLTLQSDDNARFVWQDWVDAAMGFMKGFDERVDVSKTDERRIMRPNLQQGIVELSPLHQVDNRRCKETNTARIWMGWPAFDVRICKFEMEQLLAVCGIELRPTVESRIDSNAGAKEALDSELERAERLLEGILSSINDGT